MLWKRNEIKNRNSSFLFFNCASKSGSREENTGSLITATNVTTQSIIRIYLIFTVVYIFWSRAWLEACSVTTTLLLHPLQNSILTFHLPHLRLPLFFAVRVIKVHFCPTWGILLPPLLCPPASLELLLSFSRFKLGQQERSHTSFMVKRNYIDKKSRQTQNYKMKMKGKKWNVVLYLQITYPWQIHLHVLYGR